MSQNPAPPTPGSASAPESTKLIVIALILAVLAVILVQVYIQAVKSGSAEESFPVFRLRVAKDPGDELTDDDVERLTVPDRFRDSFRDIVEDNGQGQPLRLGDEFTRHVEPYELLTHRLFESVDDEADRRLIQQGFRGVALPVVAERLPEPLRAEMRVDLLAPVRSQTTQPDILVVMENVRIVSVGDRNIEDDRVTDTRRRGNNFQTITIEVPPEEAVLLTEIAEVVQQVGVFHVLLRSPDDRTPFVIETGGINDEVLTRLNLTASTPSTP